MPFLYFLKTAAKNRIIFHFLKSRYFRLGGCSKMNLGILWETYLGLLKILFHKFSHNIAKFSHVTFIFDVLSESRIGFFSFLVYLALRNVVSSMKTRVCPERSSVSWICGNVSRQHWPQFGISYWQDICLIGNRNCARKRDVPNLIFLHFSQSSPLSFSVALLLI